ncbi:MAG: hypothetical protein JSS00_08545 [Proteobacteria bacterium]|nr:hypothetical protein [Pseudomonadota bacterium]
MPSPRVAVLFARMRNGSPIRLRETPHAAPTGARIIDASYQVVGRKKRSLLGRIWITCVAIFWAAVIGLLIPPIWLIGQRLLGN